MIYIVWWLQKVQERWYEKLHEWDKALSAYERQQEKNPDDTNFLYGRMRCLEALGEWYGRSLAQKMCNYVRGRSALR